MKRKFIFFFLAVLLGFLLPNCQVLSDSSSDTDSQTVIIKESAKLLAKKSLEKVFQIDDLNFDKNNFTLKDEIPNERLRKVFGQKTTYKIFTNAGSTSFANEKFSITGTWTKGQKVGVTLIEVKYRKITEE